MFSNVLLRFNYFLINNLNNKVKNKIVIIII